MSCWVVPAIAAELWKVPVARVLEQIQGGQIPCKTEYGFTLVDIAPNSPNITAPRRQGPPPPTFVQIPRESLERTRATPPDPGHPATADPNSGEAVSWIPVRRAAGKTRRPPQRKLPEPIPA